MSSSRSQVDIRVISCANKTCARLLINVSGALYCCQMCIVNPLKGGGTVHHQDCTNQQAHIRELINEMQEYI